MNDTEKATIPCQQLEAALSSNAGADLLAELQEAKHQQKLGWERAAEKDRAYGQALESAARLADALRAATEELFSEANRLANHGSSGLEKRVEAALYAAANKAKAALREFDGAGKAPSQITNPS